MTVPILTTERLILRGPKHTDSVPLAAFLTSPRAYVAEALKLPPLFSFVEAANLRSRKPGERRGATHESDVRFDGHDFQVYRHAAPEALT